jgi:hypothetical protein
VLLCLSTSRSTGGLQGFPREKRALVKTEIEQELVVSNKTVGKHKLTRFEHEGLEEGPPARFDAVQKEKDNHSGCLQRRSTFYV